MKNFGDSLPEEKGGNYFNFDYDIFRFISGTEKGAISGANADLLKRNVKECVEYFAVGLQTAYLSKWKIQNDPDGIDRTKLHGKAIESEKGFTYMQDKPITMYFVAFFNRIDENISGSWYVSNPVFDTRYDYFEMNEIFSTLEGKRKKQHRFTGLINKNSSPKPKIEEKDREYADRYYLVYIPQTQQVAAIKATKTFEAAIAMAYAQHPSSSQKDWKKCTDKAFYVAPHDSDAVYAFHWDLGFNWVTYKEKEGIVDYDGGRSAMLTPSLKMGYFGSANTDEVKKTIEIRMAFANEVRKEQERIRKAINSAKTIPDLIIEESDDRQNPAQYANNAADRIFDTAANTARQEPANAGWPSIPPATTQHNIGVMGDELPPPPNTADLPF